MVGYSTLGFLVVVTYYTDNMLIIYQHINTAIYTDNNILMAHILIIAVMVKITKMTIHLK